MEVKGKEHDGQPDEQKEELHRGGWVPGLHPATSIDRLQKWSIKLAFTAAYLRAESLWWWLCSVRYNLFPPASTVPASLSQRGEQV